MSAIAAGQDAAQARTAQEELMERARPARQGHGGPKDLTSKEHDITTCATRENSYSEGEDKGPGSEQALSTERLEDYPFYDDDDDEGEDEGGLSFATRAPKLRDSPASPRPPTAPRPSLGSRLHASGDCRPCAWYWKPGSCTNGSGCGHCHECPEGEIAERRKARAKDIRRSSVRQSLSEMPPRKALAASARAPTAALWVPPAGFPAAALPAASVVAPVPFPMSRLPLALARVQSLTMPGRPAAEALSPMMAPALSLPVPSSLPGGELPCPPPGLELEPMTVGRTGTAASATLVAVERTASAPAGPVVCHPSVGSSLHAAGMCKPCAWYWKPGGCQNAQECRHCHLCPPGEIAARKRRAAAGAAARRDPNAWRAAGWASAPGGAMAA
ncbi:unnamed protein product [Prorocentrum cordatum]|uniref:C3H1-type domain-containing protein n=1 Tax=Prorocentrum cordatum TaxID=2364126 RepID=A0ABN9UPX1_9DINO|nr:unnamed protein product [Polarella glacialis]